MTGDRVTEINGAKVADALNTVIIDRDNLRRERDDIFTELKAITEERDRALKRAASRDAALARVEAALEGWETYGQSSTFTPPYAAKIARAALSGTNQEGKP